MSAQSTDCDVRAARSVHLWWQLPPGCSAFCNEVTVLETTAGSYFCGAGWSGGYLGIQDLGGRGRRVLFSIWDSGSVGDGSAVGDDPAAVASADRVAVVYEADRVVVRRFGGEGTGAQCLDDVTGWECGTAVALCVAYRSEPDGASYAGFVDGLHLATFRVRGGRPFGGFYSFVEDFRRSGVSAAERRAASYGPAWGCVGGAWSAAEAARFSASSSPTEAVSTIDVCEAGGGAAVLRTGGDLDGAHRLGSTLALGRPSGALPPALRPAWTAPGLHDRTSAPKAAPLVPPGAGCPLCAGASREGGFCAGGCCQVAQCQAAAGRHLPGQRCPWPCAPAGSLCHYHMSDGALCALCASAVVGRGPYCGSEADGACCPRQCAAECPLRAGERCGWGCAEGSTRCAYHGGEVLT